MVLWNSVTAGGGYSTFPDEFVNTGVLVFGFAWADLDTGDVILATLHPQIGRDSNQNPDAWHTHPGTLGVGASTDFCVLSLGTSPHWFEFNRDTLNLNIIADQAGVAVEDLDGAVGFTVIGDAGCLAIGLGVSITSAPVGFS